MPGCLLSDSEAPAMIVYARLWVKFFGHPSTLVVEGGLEFAADFAHAAGQYGPLLHVIDPATPWLNARTERSQQ
eukprot:1305718-Amphidinium_carterae.1